MAGVGTPRYTPPMYEIDPDAGERWLSALKLRLPNQAQHVVAVHPALRNAEDGSTELYAVLVVDDMVVGLPAALRREILTNIEDGVRQVVLGDEGYEGFPHVAFRTVTEDAAIRQGA